MPDGDLAPPKKGHSPQVFGHVYCGQTAGWVKSEDATWYGSRPWPRPQCVRQGPSSPVKGAQQPTVPSTLFVAHVYCGHGHPSQLLLSSCYTIFRDMKSETSMKKKNMVCRQHSSMGEDLSSRWSLVGEVTGR